MAGDVVSHRGEELVGKLNVKSPKLNLPNHRLIGDLPKKEIQSNSAKVGRKPNIRSLQPAELNLQQTNFTVVGLVTWPLNGSEAGVDLVLIQTSLLLLCKSSCSYAN